MAEMNFTVTESRIEQVKAALGEISSLAHAAKHIAIESSMEAGGNQMLTALIDANQTMAEKIGFLSDLCLGKLGEIAHVGKAEEWMLPPIYREAAESETA